VKCNRNAVENLFVQLYALNLNDTRMLGIHVFTFYSQCTNVAATYRFVTGPISYITAIVVVVVVAIVIVIEQYIILINNSN